MEVILFAPADSKPAPLTPWNADDFFAVDDRVRGGSSKSVMTIPEPTAGIDFSGCLDTKTLGGAGFASQAYSKGEKGFPGSSLDKDKYYGLKVKVIASPEACSNTGNSTDCPAPGDGMQAVSKYVLNLKTELPEQRPDGRRESTVVYEFAFDTLARQGDPDAYSYIAGWSDFKPTYRGRPATDAKPLNPSEIKEWSIMARSNFAKQSGPFHLRLVSITALPAQQLQLRDAVEADQSYISSPEGSGAGEYYGFALYILATVVMVLWVLWALVPDKMLKKVGIDWYPNREWAFLLPAWSLFAVLFAYAAFITLNIHNNPPLDDLRNVVDSHSNVAKLGPMVELGQFEHPLTDLSMAQTGGIDGPLADDIYDLPPGMISRERHDMR